MAPKKACREPDHHNEIKPPRLLKAMGGFPSLCVSAMLLLGFASLQEFGDSQNRGRNQSKEDTAEQNACEVLLDKRDVAEPITGPDQTEHPEETA
jgi:hypothetical protein